jgi:hypothetical protein
VLVTNQYLNTDMGYSRPLAYSPEEVSVQAFPDSELQILTIMLTIHSKAVGSGFEILILYMAVLTYIYYTHSDGVSFGYVHSYTV